MGFPDRLPAEFYKRDVLNVAPDLVGRELVIAHPGQETTCHIITETEAYRGEDDRACHASKGRTKRTEIMYHEGGVVYMYLVYGMYWMLNIVVAGPDQPQAVLIRGLDGVYGPGRLTRLLGLDGSFYGEDLTRSGRLWLSKRKNSLAVSTAPRIGIEYSGEPWKSKPWRFTAK
ncbi:MAG: DNA-3-methyladenine glycosylase [Bacteroidales bacterium]